MNNNLSFSEQDITELLSTAVDLHQSRRYPEAKKAYRILIRYLPEAWLLHYNLGLLLFEEERFDEALTSYQRAASLTSSSNDLLYNMAICQKACGLHGEAIQSYRKALRINKDDSDSYYNIAGCYSAIEQYDEAFKSYEEVLKRQPDHHQALNNLAYLCHKMGKKDQAMEHYSRLLQLNPSHLAADHMLAALSGENRPTAPDSYIREMFDHYSDTYEDSLLHKLHYSLPEKLAAFIEQTSDKASSQTVLDLGCGTGLTGQKLKALTQTMHGVDISPKMLEIARQKKLYNKIFTAEIRSFLSNCKPDSYGLLVAADVLTYMGELHDVFGNAHWATKQDSLFYFSVEALSGDNPAILLRESGRFAHSDTYVKKAARAAGWNVIAAEMVDLRKERGGWVEGKMYCMTKQTA